MSIISLTGRIASTISRTESSILGFDNPCMGGIKAEVAFAPADSSPTPLSPTSVYLLSVLTAEVAAVSAVMHWRCTTWISYVQQEISLPSPLWL